ncbi:MAG: hypothetical protein IKH21_02095 [Clostridia bacterium]|nr:hypothetical protein [Clostridia bacterium]MBR3459568.1 hypothetical protein [Clostridia bacterium]
MRFYIASSIANGRKAAALAEVLKSRGHEQTYDNRVFFDDVSKEGISGMSEAAFNGLRSVRDAELVVVLLPGGSSTHTELGLAIATRGNKRIILWSERWEDFDFNEHTCVFYFHPCIERVVCTFEELLQKLDTEQIGSDISHA